jgi:membrane protein YqaA with SNARE-associated domain
MGSLEDLNDSANFSRHKVLRRRIEIIETLMTLVLLALCIISLLSYSFYKEFFTQQILNFGYIGMFLTSGLLEFLPQFINPFLLIVMSLSAGLNVHVSILAVVIGSCFGSLLAFDIGKRHGMRFIAPLFSRKTMNKILTITKKYGAWIVFISAMTHIPPYISIVFGALKIPWKKFLLYGVLVRILTFIIGGYLVHFGIITYSL